MSDPDPSDREFLEDAAAVAARATSGPPCRACGFPMEPGLLVVRAAAYMGQSVVNLGWNEPGPRTWTPGPPIEVLPWGPAGTHHALRGFRCPECKRLELEYGPIRSPPLRPAGSHTGPE